MRIHNDELRRQLRDLDRDQREAMPKFREFITRLLVDDPDTPAEAKAKLVLGGFSRRRFMTVGGAALAGGAVLTACSGGGGGGSKNTGATTGGSGGATGTTAAGATTTTGNHMIEGSPDTDKVIARTAASLENYAVAVYGTAITNAAKLKITAPVAAAAKLFKDQHTQHAAAFNGVLIELGGTAYTGPNPTAESHFKATVDALASEADVVKFALTLEQIAAETYQKVGMMLSAPKHRVAAMSVGGVEARHAVILGMFSSPAVSFPAQVFQPTDQAIDTSFYVNA